MSKVGNEFQATWWHPGTDHLAQLSTKSEFDGAYAEGGLFLLTMHPHIIGHRSRIRLLDELIRHVRSHAGVWFATHAEVARYCKDNA